MNTDIRVAISFKGHRKRKRLKTILGEDGTGYLLDLWLTVAMDRPTGDLSGLDELDIALMAGWEGPPAVFVEAIISAGFLDRLPGGDFALHGWSEHNAYAAHADVRKGIAKRAAEARWGKRTGSPAAEKPSDAQSNAASNAAAMHEQCASIDDFDAVVVPLVKKHGLVCGLAAPAPLDSYRRWLSSGKTVDDISSVYDQLGGYPVVARQRLLVQMIDNPNGSPERGRRKGKPDVAGGTFRVDG